MAQLGMVAVMILFGMAFAIWAVMGDGSGIGFIALQESIGEGDITTIVNMIFNALVNAMSLGTIGVALIGSILAGQSKEHIFMILVLIAVAQILFVPFTFYNEALAIAPIPIEIQYLVRGFFNLIMLFAVIGFVLEREW